MRVGYARVSTTEQDMEGQLARFSDCERVFSEKYSGSKQDRAQLEACLSFVREGDTLVVTRLDRLARSVSHLCLITEGLAKKGVNLVVLDQNIDTTTPMGRLVFHVLAAIAEFELGIRKEQQRAGMAHARLNGKQIGRAAVLTTEEIAWAASMRDRGESMPTIAGRLKVSPVTVWRALSGRGAYSKSLMQQSL